MTALSVTRFAVVASRSAGCPSPRIRGLLAALLATGLATAAPAEERFFSPRSITPYEVGANGPAAAVDLNGDGRPDLIQSHYYGAIHVRLASGASGYDPPAVTSVPGYLPSFAVGELTGDGIPDIVATIDDYVMDTSEARVLPGVGDGSFGTPQVLPAGPPATSVSIGDLDSDGRQDVIVANSGGNTITIYRSVTGGFAPRVDLTTADNPRKVAIALIDGDAIPDLVVSCYSGHAISLHMGQGGGAFAPGVQIATGNSPWGLGVADMDGDANLDLVVGNVVIDACCPGACSIYRGRGDGTFDPPTYHGLGTSTIEVAIADLDLDGALDIVTMSLIGFPGLQRVLSVLQGADGWSSAGQTFHPAEPDPRSLQLADVDLDGRLDAVIGGVQPYVVVAYGTSPGPLEPWSAFPVDMTVASIALADFNQDGHDDLFAGSTYGPVGVRLGNGDGSFGPVAHSGTDFSSGCLADVDADGRLDVVGTDAQGLRVLHGDGDGTFTPGPSSFPAGDGVNGIAAGDLDEDGRLDLVATSITGLLHPTGEIAIFMGVGGGNFAPRVVFQAGPWERPYLADLDVDGDLDLIASGNVFLGVGNGGFDSYPVAWVGPPLAIGLIDGDAIPDIVDVQAGLAVSLGLGNGSFGYPVYVNSVMPPGGAAIHDLDGDGHSDIVWTTEGTVHVVRGDGQGGFQPATHYVACGSPGDVAVGSLNGDPRPDMAFGCIWGASIAVLFNDHPGYPTSTLLAVASAEALPGLVRMGWYGVGAGTLAAVVERRTGSTEWQAVGTARVIGADRLEFEDRAVAPGERYAYRLVESAAAAQILSEEVWLTVPREASFGLTGALPRPGGGFQVFLSLASREDAALEVVDVSGRRIHRQAIGELGPGPHEVSVTPGRRLAAGLYLLRITQGSRSATIKASVVP